MKLLNINRIIAISGILLTIALFASCKHGNNDTGYAYMPDMAYSNAYETNTENPAFKNGRTNQLPVEGTVPREMIPYQYEKTFADQVRAGVELVNPFEATKENLEQGKKQYDIYCAICHGDKGRGDGHLYTSKLFPPKPTALHDAYVQNKPDGEIYHVVTMGSLSGLMGAHGSQIKPDDRWKIILFVKNGFKTK
jgi:mono/diheme cytochrome c family protein